MQREIERDNDNDDKEEERIVRMIVKANLVVVFVVLMIAVTGGYVWAVDGVTDTEIRIGTTMDLSGPIAFLGQGMKDGATLYFEYINDQGGIHGRKIKFLAEDDGFQSPRAVLAAKKLITKDKVFCMTMNLGSGACNAMYPLLEKHGIAMVPAGTANEALAIPPRKYLFMIDTGYTIQGQLGVRYVIETLGAKNIKPACIYQEDITGKQLLGGVKMGLEKYGIRDCLELSYKRGSVDFSAQVAKCKDAGVTHIFMHTNVREPASIMKEAQRLQYKATYICDNASMMTKVIELAGDALTYSNGFYLTGLMRDIKTEDTPTLRAFKESVAKYKIGNVDWAHCFYAFGAAKVLCEALERAGRNLTHAGFIKACESIKDFESGIFAPITWGPDRRDGERSVKMYKAEGGDWVPISDWINI